MSIDTTADVTAIIDTTPADTTAAIPTRTVYVTADPDRPPYEYEGRHRRGEVQAAARPARRGKRWLAAALSVVGISLTMLTACGPESCGTRDISRYKSDGTVEHCKNGVWVRER